MTKLGKLAALLACASSIIVSIPAAATGASAAGTGPLGTTCSAKTSTDTPAFKYQLCTGLVNSWDGTPLDVDVTLPATASRALPLLVMMHGWGNNKGDWESTSVAGGSPDTGNYNNLWFASRGYAVLNYSARGFGGSCGVSAMPWSQVCATQGWTHLADRRYEIQDTHYLVGQLVDAKVADAKHIGVTGGSYGGGQSWLLALEGDQQTVLAKAGDPTSAKLVPWTSPKGTRIHLSVAVPKYPWTDLVEALQPNGQASDGVVQKDASRLTPYGINKQSFVAGLFATGAASGHYAPPGVDSTANLALWNVAIQAGEPTYNAANPVLTEALTQLSQWKSAYYQDDLIKADVKARDEVPVLTVQGFTDQLFSESQSISMTNKLLAADPNWKVSAYFGDLGHQPAANKAADWKDINAAANKFIDYYMKGAGVRPANTFWARATTCDSTTGATFTAPSWKAIATKRTVFTSTVTGNATASAPHDQPEGILSDPIASQVASKGCITDNGLEAGPAASATYNWLVKSAFSLVGQPVLTLNLTLDGVDAEVDVRMWVQHASGGFEVLVSRGVFRDTTTGAHADTIVLNGNAWTFAAGDRIYVQLTQNDAPYVRIDNLPSAIQYTGAVTLTLPTR